MPNYWPDKFVDVEFEPIRLPKMVMPMMDAMSFDRDNKFDEYDPYEDDTNKAIGSTWKSGSRRNFEKESYIAEDYSRQLERRTGYNGQRSTFNNPETLDMARRLDAKKKLGPTMSKYTRFNEEDLGFDNENESIMRKNVMPASAFRTREQEMQLRSKYNMLPDRPCRPLMQKPKRILQCGSNRRGNIYL